MGFLNETGLTRLWAKILDKLSGKVDIVEGKGLSTNDYTTNEKAKVANIATHIVDGIGNGSVRTTNTKAEDSNYSLGQNAVAFGSGTEATADNAFAEGNNTSAEGSNQHVQGKFNKRNTNLAHIVGNGTSDSARSNCHTLDWKGNAWFNGDVYVGSLNGTDKDLVSQKLATEYYVQSYAKNGGRNYLRNTGALDQSGYLFGTAGTTVGTVTYDIDKQAIKVVNTDNNTSIFLKDLINVSPGEKFTISMECYFEVGEISDIQFAINCVKNDNTNTFLYTNGTQKTMLRTDVSSGLEWTVLYDTFTVPSDTKWLQVAVAQRIYGVNYTDTFYFRRIQLEKGLHMTDWHPAPEDLEIGGRNLATGTAKLQIASSGNVANRNWRKSGTGTIENIALTDSQIEGITQGVRITATQSGTQIGIKQDGYNLVAGQPYTVSCWIKPSQVGVVCVLEAHWSATDGSCSKTFTLSDGWQRLVFTGVPNESGNHSGPGVFIPKWNTQTGVFIDVCAIQFERGNTVTSWRPALEDMQVGGKNLLLATNQRYENANYLVASYNLGNDVLKEAEEFTLRLWGSLGSDRSGFMAYNSGAYVQLGKLTDQGNGTYVLKGRWTNQHATQPVSNPTLIRIYASPNSGTSTSIIEKIKLERGNVATDWSPALEDGVSKLNTGDNPDGVSAEISAENFEIRAKRTNGSWFTLNNDLLVTNLVHANMVQAPNVTQYYTGPSTIKINASATDAQVSAETHFRNLSDAFAKLSNKYLTYDVTVSFETDSAGSAELRNVTGNSVIIDGKNFTSNGSISVKRCFSTIKFLNLKIIRDTAQTFTLGLWNVSFAEINKCIIRGQGADSCIVALEGTKVWVINSELYYAKYLIQMTYLTSLQANNIKGCFTSANPNNCNFISMDGAEARWLGTRPAGTVRKLGNPSITVPTDLGSLSANQGTP